MDKDLELLKEIAKDELAEGKEEVKAILINSDGTRKEYTRFFLVGIETDSSLTINGAKVGDGELLQIENYLRTININKEKMRITDD